MRLTIVQPAIGVASETFLHAQATRLPCHVSVVHHRSGIPVFGERPALSLSMLARGVRKILHHSGLLTQQYFLTPGYLNIFEKTQPDIVLAQYGPTGVKVMEACHIAKVPLAVHFHGYDASRKGQLALLADDYHRMFARAATIVAVSHAMRAQLVEIGAPSEKVVYNPYGVDCQCFEGGNPGTADPVFIAVGRFVEKKAPHLTIQAFAEVSKRFPEARLRMIGDGPLRARCVDLTEELGVNEAVQFLGVQPPEVVQREMRVARAFVQHSITAPDGDSEGTPVAILEAGATGLPVIATRHAGIPDVVVNERTGLLVDEGDVQGMTDAMIRIVGDASLAERLGLFARNHIRSNYSMEHHIDHLHQILANAATRGNALLKDGDRYRDFAAC